MRIWNKRFDLTAEIQVVRGSCGGMVRRVTVEVEVPDGLADVIEDRRSEVEVELSFPDRRRGLPTEESEVSDKTAE